jgi:hypothetical protein
MRSLPLALALGIVASATCSPVHAADTDTKSLVVSAQFRPRTALKVSTQILRFDVDPVAGTAIAAVDFSAAARTHEGGEVMLSVEPMRAIKGPGGAADVEAAVTFAGEGEGTLPGELRSVAPAIAARWTGSGVRTGRLTFSLRAAASGTYTMPIRFVLTAP